MERCLHQTGGLAPPGQVDRDYRCRQRPRRRTENFVTTGAPWEGFGQNSGTDTYGNAPAVAGADSNATDSAYTVAGADSDATDSTHAVTGAHSRATDSAHAITGADSNATDSAYAVAGADSNATDSPRPGLHPQGRNHRRSLRQAYAVTTQTLSRKGGLVGRNPRQDVRVVGLSWLPSASAGGPPLSSLSTRIYKTESLVDQSYQIECALRAATAPETYSPCMRYRSNVGACSSSQPIFRRA